MDNNWSSDANWNPDGSPAGQNVTFGDFDETTVNTVNSMVNNPTANPDYTWTIESLTFNNTGTTASDWQNLSIDAGVTLKIEAAGTPPANILTVGGYTAADTTTQVKISGAGSLVVNESASDIWVSNRGADGSSANRAFLDMSGLSSFTANVNNFLVGTSIVNQQADSSGYVALANTNTITANKLAVGSSPNGQNDGSSLVLGRQNTINADNIYVGAPYTVFTAATSPTQRANTVNGFINFNPSLSPTEQNSVVIRATDGISRANLTIGEHGGNGTTNRGVTASVDFSGGTVDALIGNLNIALPRGAGGGSSFGRITASLLMDDGIMDVLNTTLARSVAGGGTGVVPGVGTLTVAGGTFNSDTFIMAWNSGGSQDITANFNISGDARVNLDAGIVLGDRDGTAANVLPTLTISGGTVTAGGNIAEASNGGSITSVINFNGGTLDLGNRDIGADTFNARAGVLKNVREIRNGAAVPAATALVKSGNGSVLTLAGSNAFTGGMTVDGGTLLVESGAMTSTGTITVNANGALALNYSGVQSLLNSGRIAPSSAGSIALTSANASENIDFSATGAGLEFAYLGAYGDVTYSGTFTPFSAGVYRLGGGLGKLTYTANITGSESVVIGGGLGTVVLAGTNDFSGGITLNAGNLQVTAVDDLGSASNALTFNGGVLQWAPGFAGDILSGRTVTIGAGGATLDTNGNSPVVAGSLDGAGSLTKSGAGALSLTGLSTYSGTTTVSQGSLVLDLSTNTTGVLNSASNLVLNGGALSVIGAASGASSQTLGTVILSSGTASTISVNSGTGTGTTVTLGAWTRGSGSTLNVTRTGSGSITFTTSPTTDDGILAYATVTQGGTTRFSNGALAQFTTASTLGAGTNSSTTNYITTGSITRSAVGTINSLQIDNTATGTLDLNGRNLTIASGGLLMTGTADYSITNTSVTGASLSTGASTELIIHQYGSGVLTIGTTLNDSGIGGVTKTGSGTAILDNAASSYVEATVITGGVLGVTTLANGGNASSIGASTSAAGNLVLNGGILRYQGATSVTTDRNYTLGSNGGGFESSGAGDLTIWGQMTVASTSGAQTFTLGGTNTLRNRLTGNITDGTGSVTSFIKNGTGKWVVSGYNDFSGSTTVTAGTLIVDGSLTRTSGVTVEADGAIGGNGTISSSLLLNSGADFTADIGGVVAGTGYDQLTVSGPITLSGANLALTLSYAPTANDAFTLLNNTGAGAFTGLFATINGASFGAGNSFFLTYNSVSYEFQLSYNGGTGNDLVVMAIPEPSTLALFGLALAACRWRFRRLSRLGSAK